jgi:hypothetical protein
MGVNYGAHVGPHAVNGEMHLQLGGWLAFAFELRSVKGAHDRVVLGEHSFACAGRGDQDAIPWDRVFWSLSVRHPDGKVSIAGGDPSFFGHQPADPDDLLA